MPVFVQAEPDAKVFRHENPDPKRVTLLLPPNPPGLVHATTTCETLFPDMVCACGRVVIEWQAGRS